jgi:galactonate dehydratase
MKIADIRSYIARVGHRNQLLVAVETDDGIVGWGESGYTSRERSVMGILDHVIPWLIGQDPRRREAIFQEIYRSGYFEGGRSLVAAAAAIDIALYDILGKAWSAPVYDLLGGACRRVVRCMAHLPDPINAGSVAAAKSATQAGWGAIRIQLDHSRSKYGPETFDPPSSFVEALEWLPKLREAVGHSITVGLHGHHRFSQFEAASLLRKLPAGLIDYMEEPIRNQSVAAYQALRRMTAIPFAIGSEFPSKWEFAPFIEDGLCDIVRLDVGLMGLTEAKKVSAMAETHYLDVLPHNPLGPIATAAAAHLAMSIPNHLFLEIRESPTESLGFYSAPGFDKVLLPEANGDINVMDTPGLGIAINEAALSAKPAPDYELPHWRRVDGSYGNW